MSLSVVRGAAHAAEAIVPRVGKFVAILPAQQARDLSTQDVFNGTRSVAQKILSGYYDLVGLPQLPMPESFTSRLQARNAALGENARTAVVLQAVSCHNGALTHRDNQYFIYRMASEFRVSSTSLPVPSMLGSQLKAAKEANQNRPVQMLVINAHGDKDSVACGSLGWVTDLTKADLKKEDFAALDKDAVIVLLACETGQELASDLARISGHPVIASKERINATNTAFVDGRVIAWDDKNVVSILEKHLPDGTVEPIELGDTKVLQEFLWDRYTYFCQIDAEGGNAAAQFQLGMLYEQGSGVEKSQEKALEWYRKAAEQGYFAAQSAVRRLDLISRA